MTAQETALAIALGACRFVPGSWEKRFARDMAARARARPEDPLMPKQARWLRRLHHKYRRQIPSHRCNFRCRLEELPGSL